MTPLRALLIALLLGGCSSGDPVDRLVSRLSDSTRREQSIDALLVLVRQTPRSSRPRVQERVVHALMEAYREDTARPAIVAALALLRDKRAEEVFVAAVRDADRGGGYFDAAVRSARMIGELDLRNQVPTLVKALDRLLSNPREDRNTWLERSLIQALERLADPRAVPVLIKALGANPTRIDFYINRMAAHALGVLRDPRAVDPLIASLGATSHGLLLYEESRRALCRIGAPAIKGLLRTAGRRDAKHRPAAIAPAAVAVLGDLGRRDLAPAITALARPDDPPELQLALARTLLRLGQRDAQQSVLRLLQDRKASITHRRQAADILGWYGSEDVLAPLLPTLCAPGPRGGASLDSAGQLLCFSAVLANGRTQLSADGAPELQTLLDPMGEAGRQRLAASRVRIDMVQSCAAHGEAPALRDCLLHQLSTATNWRVQERAALRLRRLAPTLGMDLALPLARRLPTVHPQVQQAILVSLEQLQLRPEDLGAVHKALQTLIDGSGKEAGPHGATSPGIIGRATCLDERLRVGHEAAGETRNGEKR